MIPIIVPIIPRSDRDHYERRPTVFGILFSVIILTIGLFLAFFLILTGDYASPVLIISIVVTLVLVGMGLATLTIVRTSVSTPEFERDEYRGGQPPIRNYNRDRSNKEYCNECGTVVDFSDSFCTTCGARLERWN